MMLEIDPLYTMIMWPTLIPTGAAILLAYPAGRGISL